jgi:hypothetical protein
VQENDAIFEQQIAERHLPLSLIIAIVRKRVDDERT